MESKVICRVEIWCRKVEAEVNDLLQIKLGTNVPARTLTILKMDIGNYVRFD